MLKIIYKNCILGHNLVRNLSINGSCNKLAYIQNIGRQPLTYETMGQQFQKSVQQYAKRFAIKSWYDQRQMTYEELYEEAAIMAVKLHELGLNRGEHLAIWAPNTIQWLVTFVASFLGGFPLVCINPALEKPELKYALAKAKTKTIITMDCYGKLDFLTKLEQDVTNSYKVIMKTDKNPKRILNYEQWLHSKPSSEKINDLRHKIGELQPESPLLMQFTSGTTGNPKCAVISHYNMVNQAVYLGNALKLNHGQKSICLAVPMFHAFGLGVISAAIKYGSTLYLPSPMFNAEACLDTIERNNCNVVMGTPSMFVDLLEQQRRLQRNVSDLDVAFVGGAYASSEIISQINKLLNVEVRQGYGMSEATTAAVASDGSESIEEVKLSCGKLFEHGEAKVINEDGKTVKFGETGELCIRGWFTMLGYFEDESSTMKTIDFNGWLRTGDKFSLEWNGAARYQGRKKDMLIRGGENIYPKEIENVIDQHPSILESQVIGVPHQRLGEEVCVYLRLRSDAQPLTLKDVADFCKGHLAYFKIPTHVRIVKEFPKTTSGKIQKFKLQQMFQTETS